jgi:hypothetical protein
MWMKLYPNRIYLIVQVGLGTTIVGLSTIFWQYETAQPGLLFYFAVGLGVILHAMYIDSRRTDGRIKQLKKDVAHHEVRIEQLQRDVEVLKAGKNATPAS